MFKIYDVRCEKCGLISEQWVETGKRFEKCPCGGELERIFSSFNFKLLYNPKKDKVGWANSGYAESRYYDDYKAEKEKGNDVRPYDE